MAHNLEEINGEYCFVECTHYGDIKPAWHGLGERFDEPMTIEFAMEKAHMDWNVSMQPVVALTPELKTAMDNNYMISGDELRKCIIDGASCNMRDTDNKVFAITSEKYGLIQNKDAFRFINNICGKGEDEPIIETMGSLSDGTSFATIRMKNVYDLGKGDDVDMYLIVKNSFNNKGALSVFTSFQRVVCENTLNASFQGAQSKMFIRHTKNAYNKLEDIENAARTLKFYELYKDAFISNMEKLKSIKLTDKQCEGIICKALFSDDAYRTYVKTNFNRHHTDISTRSRNIVENAMNVLDNGIGQRECKDKGTGLWLYNGITTLFNNHVNYKNNEKKFNSIIGGTADEKQQKVFDLILEAA